MNRLGILVFSAVIALGARAYGAGSVAPLRAMTQAADSGTTPVHPPTGMLTEAAAAVNAYWTSERMAAAIPMDAVLAGPANPVSSSPGPSGTPLFVDGTEPGEPPGGLDPMAASEQAFPSPAVPTVWYPYPYPYTRSWIGGGWPELYPLRTNGRLFFTQIGVNYSCSATSLTSGTGGNRRIAWTAGRCLHAGDNNSAHWSYNILFCPAWVAGAPGPWGCWASLDRWTTTGWVQSGNAKLDYGLVQTGDVSSLGYGRLGDTIGSQGFATSVAGPNEFWSLGYPAAAPYDGNTLVWTTSGEAAEDDPNPLWTGPLPIGVGSDVTAGAFGGAWLINARLGSVGFLNGHNDYRYDTQPLAMYSPYYDAGTFAFWDALRTEFP